jgi:hypothetical protein
MKINLKKFTIGQVAEGYTNSDEEGVVGFGGKLNIRPKYQREFVYDNNKRNAVMDTVWKGFPLNVMYWVHNADDTYELLDGQQRTISFCSYIVGEYFMNFDNNLRGFDNLTAEQKKKILNYELQIYVCEGTPSDQLDWFRIINIAGEKLTDQELLNAVYCGSWVTQAKRRFSKTGCVAYKLGSDYMNGSTIRQDYLETALKWLSNGNIEEYMAAHQHDEDADELWQYFQNVIHWVQTLFPKYYKEMKGIDWGLLYNEHKDESFKASELEKQVNTLMQDVDVSNKKGIYTYLMTGDEKYLNIRAFDARMKREAYERQQGICAKCGKHFEIGEMEADHITPWCEGGKTLAENCQMLCRECNRRKSNN